MERLKVKYTLKANEDFLYFKSTGQKDILKKIRKIIESIQKTPFEGIGKPEPLKYGLSGTWSRRINKEHRVVYEIFGETIFILSLKDHYLKI